MKYWQTKRFSQLEKEWYEKLRKVGFEDKERKLGKEQGLIQNASYSYRQTPEVIRETKVIYFNLLCKHVAKDRFDNEADKVIMQARSEGQKIKEISEKLKQLGHNHHRQTIRYRIRKYEHQWKIRFWTDHQLNPPWRDGNRTRKKRRIPIP